MFKIIRRETDAVEAANNRHQWPVEFTVLNSADDSPAKVFVMQESADPDVFEDSLSCVANAIQMTDLPEDVPREGSPYYRVSQVTKNCRSAEAASEFVEKVEDAIQNLADNLSDAASLGAKTVKGIAPAGDPTPSLTPEFIALSPSNGQLLVTPLTAEITFHEDVQSAAGNITVRNITDTVDTLIPVGDAQITFSGAIVTIAPTVAFDDDKTYAILIDPGAIEDLDGNDFAGIADDTTWRFTTRA